METSSESATCLLCFEIIEKHIFVGSNAAAKILKNCKTYLHSTLTKETLKDVQLKNENQMPLCKRCFDSAWDIIQLHKQLNTVQKEISDLTVTFSFEVCHRRRQVDNSQTQNNSQNGNKSSTKQLNVSGLPANTFLTKEGCQNVQQLNQISNRNIIIDDQTDENIQITNVKFESCDLQLEDLPEDSQQTTSNVDAEILFSNESQDYNQPGLENTINLELKREFETTEENECVDSTNSKDDDSQVVMSDLTKSVKMPQIELERINIVDLKVKARSTSSCQQKSQPRHQLLNKIKNQNNEFPNSNLIVGKLLKCFYCEKTFKQGCNRNIHHRTHTGEKPYKCSFCTKQFAHIGNLTRHERIHTGEKPYKCSFCKNRFTQIGHMKDHEKTHTGEKPYKCSFCKNRFTQIGQMKDHEKTHTGEKPYECSFCKKGFITSRNTKRHERTHTGEKPYKCLYCEETFGQSTTRNKHQSSHKTK